MRFPWPRSRDVTITCRRAVELVTAYLDGALSTDDQTRFETHLIYCPPCVEHLKHVRATIQATGRLRHQRPRSSSPHGSDGSLPPVAGRGHFMTRRGPRTGETTARNTSSCRRTNG